MFAIRHPVRAIEYSTTIPFRQVSSSDVHCCSKLQILQSVHFRSFLLWDNILVLSRLIGYSCEAMQDDAEDALIITLEEVA